VPAGSLPHRVRSPGRNLLQTAERVSNAQTRTLAPEDRTASLGSISCSGVAIAKRAGITTDEMPWGSDFLLDTPYVAWVLTLGLTMYLVQELCGGGVRIRIQ
jgi:hypothetical protein